MTSKLAGKFLVAIMVIGLSGCATSFKSDVSSWHQLPRPNGESFVILAKDGAKQSSIEFSHYAEYLSQALQQIGYRPARTDQPADLVVRLDYGMSLPRSDVRSNGSYIGMGYYGRGPYHGYGLGHYGYGGAFDGPDVRTYALYSSYLEMDIASARDAGKNLYESKVISEGRSNHLEDVVPLLIDSMFQDFPGPSGVTRRVVLDQDPAAQQ